MSALKKVAIVFEQLQHIQRGDILLRHDPNSPHITVIGTVVTATPTGCRVQLPLSEKELFIPMGQGLHLIVQRLAYQRDMTVWDEDGDLKGEV